MMESRDLTKTFQYSQTFISGRLMTESLKNVQVYSWYIIRIMSRAGTNYYIVQLWFFILLVLLCLKVV